MIRPREDGQHEGPNALSAPPSHPQPVPAEKVWKGRKVDRLVEVAPQVNNHVWFDELVFLKDRLKFYEPSRYL